MSREAVDVVVKDEDDLRRLDELMAALKGQRLSSANFSYGDELQLHFGSMRPYRGQARLQRGDWLLSTRASPWLVLINSATLLTSSGESRGEAQVALQGLEGVEVTAIAARVGDLALVVVFANRTSFVVLSQPLSRRQKNSLTLWELLRPEGDVLWAGPDRRWGLEPPAPTAQPRAEVIRADKVVAAAR